MNLIDPIPADQEQEAVVDCTVVFAKNWDAMTAQVVNKNGELENKYRYIINEGSSRSSKTHSLFQIFYKLGFETSNKRISVWRDTKKDCVETVFQDMLRAYRTFENYNLVQFNRTKTYFTFPFENVIEAEGTDDGEKVHGFNGDIAWFNEPYKISRDTFDQIDQRTTGHIFIDWNPKKAHWIDDLKKDPRAIVIHSTYKDNNFCPIEEKRKIESYQPVKYATVVTDGKISEQKALKYKLGTNPLKFSDSEIQELQRCIQNEHQRTANEFNWLVYGLGLKAERPNRIFHWQQISLNEYNKIDEETYIGVDWGAVDPWGVVEIKYYDGALYVRELNYASENDIKGKLTPTQYQQIGETPEGLVKWYFNKLGVSDSSYIICDDNRPAKVMALREAGYDYALATKKGKGSLTDGIDLLNNMPVYYTSDSENIKYEQENYSRKVDRYGIVLEEPEDMDNHLIDPVRYVARFLRIQGIIKVI